MKKLLAVTILLLGTSVGSRAQQKGQWTPGQIGLNAGAVPDPGFTYQNLAVNYSASQLNDKAGNAVPGLVGEYAFWLDQNYFFFVPKRQILRAYFAPYVSVNVSNGSLVANIIGTDLSRNDHGAGLADTFVAPVSLGWRFNRADLSASYAFVVPTGRFSPDASDNVSSGYWGNNLIIGSTAYLTKSKRTSANLFVVWEGHGATKGTNITPGQALTNEWGVGQVLPLDNQMKKQLQVGVVGYDQWQVSDNRGNAAPRYSVHGIGFQTTFLVPDKGLSLFFKYYDEYDAKAHPIGHTISFGGAWTIKLPDK